VAKSERVGEDFWMNELKQYKLKSNIGRTVSTVIGSWINMTGIMVDIFWNVIAQQHMRRYNVYIRTRTLSPYGESAASPVVINLKGVFHA
jgi:hypothetical protein